MQWGQGADLGPPPMIWALTLSPAERTGRAVAHRICAAREAARERGQRESARLKGTGVACDGDGCSGCARASGGL
jgi:hypothetical protein